MPLSERVHWFGASSERSGCIALAERAAGLLHGADNWVLSVGDHSGFHRRLNRALESRAVAYRSLALDDALRLDSQEVAGLACVLVGDSSSRGSTSVARALLASEHLRSVPVEYVSGLDNERRQFHRDDEYRDAFFVSPVLLADPSAYALYEESLRLFEQKCGLRDFLDLYQLIESIGARKIEGAVAEFGSYKGHSGWLIARTLQALDMDRSLLMFDAFESFPDETIGVDHFWSRTHAVDFEDVRSKFSGFPFVTLVPGDFTATWPASGSPDLALAYVDCDSYRAVSYVAGLFDEHIAPGGIMVFEDYGHPALLGSRLAVHEYFDGRVDCVQFFSQFSGCYIVIKTPMVPTGDGGR
jgi:predicted O-methyltransferase YrrM